MQEDEPYVMIFQHDAEIGMLPPAPQRERKTIWRRLESLVLAVNYLKLFM